MEYLIEAILMFFAGVAWYGAGLLIDILASWWRARQEEESLEEKLDRIAKATRKGFRKFEKAASAGFKVCQESLDDHEERIKMLESAVADINSRRRRGGR